MTNWGAAAAQLAVVVQLAVEDQHVGAVPHRLVRALVEIDDAEAGVQQADVPAVGRHVLVDARSVGPAVAHNVRHSEYHVPINRTFSLRICNPANAAHLNASSCS